MDSMEEIKSNALAVLIISILILIGALLLKIGYSFIYVGCLGTLGASLRMLFLIKKESI